MGQREDNLLAECADALEELYSSNFSRRGRYALLWEVARTAPDLAEGLRSCLERVLTAAPASPANREWERARAGAVRSLSPAATVILISPRFLPAWIRSAIGGVGQI